MFSSRCKIVSLGQNVVAQKLLTEAFTQGDWIIFENSDSIAEWMPTLECLYINLIKSNEINDDFRWWFVIEPTHTFPLIMLREGIKFVFEHPPDIPTKILEQYSTEPLTDDKYFNNAFTASTLSNWYRCVFALTAFHAVVQERTHFNAIGWSTPYNFDEILFQVSITHLRRFLKQFQTVPYDDLFYLMNDCYYASEIVDENDRRLLHTLLHHFCNKNLESIANYKFFENGEIHIPCESNRKNVIEYLISLTSKCGPNDVGLHENAQYKRNIKDGKNVSRILLNQTY